MFKPKYVIYDGCAIIFSPAITHSTMIPRNETCEGAGFVDFITDTDTYGDIIIKAVAYGESVSIGIESRGDIDSMILTRQITNPSF